MPVPLTRRSFLAALVAGAAGAAVGGCSDGNDDAGPGTTTTTRPPPELSGPAFTLGVASGDPLPDSVILWTRLAPEPLDGGGMPEEDVDVRWEVATDDRFADVVAQGVATASPALAHSVHVDADGLEPATRYWYRFTVGDQVSPVGRTRTTPGPGDSPDRLRFAFASCQDWRDGYWTAYPHLAEEDLDLVVFLGDYIYEGGAAAGAVRPHNSDRVVSLDGYRNRYGLYKGDPGLQAAHAAFPWVLAWDDHEVANNYADDRDQGDNPVAGFLRRRAAAYQAYYEHQPIRVGPPDGPDLELYRSLRWGDLASFFVLDTRQYRSEQACDGISDIGPACPAVADGDRTMLGEEQERWLFDGLDRSEGRWNVIANQVILGRTAIPVGGTDLYNLDQWDGYTAARRRVLDFIHDRRPSNPVVITGDIHSSGVGDLLVDFDDPGSDIVGTEFVGTSISSIFTPEFLDIVETAARAAPWISYYEARQRGYVRCEVTPDRWQADYRLVDTIAEPSSPITTASSWALADGARGVRPA